MKNSKFLFVLLALTTGASAQVPTPKLKFTRTFIAAMQADKLLDRLAVQIQQVAPLVCLSINTSPAEANPSEASLDGTYDIRTLPEDLTRPSTLSDMRGPGKVFMDQIANPKFFPKGSPASPDVLQGHAVYLPSNWATELEFRL